MVSNFWDFCQSTSHKDIAQKSNVYWLGSAVISSHKLVYFLFLPQLKNFELMVGYHKTTPLELSETVLW